MFSNFCESDSDRIIPTLDLLCLQSISRASLRMTSIEISNLGTGQKHRPNLGRDKTVHLIVLQKLI